MSIAKFPSKLSLPEVNPGCATVLEYLQVRFPGIAAEVWSQRMVAGRVHWHDGSLINERSPFRPQQRVYYYREVAAEPQVPFAEQILFKDEHLLLAYKPHFLPVTPGGAYINECLQNRLRQKTGIQTLQALHRLDRPTAGLVLFSVNPETRHRYHGLFESRQIEKRYQAIAQVAAGEIRVGQQWEIKNRLEPAEPRFLMAVTGGVANSYSQIRCLAQVGDRALFELQPVTGKTHQLRVHMQTLGWPILNDRYYPTLQAESADDYSRPLQLLAKELRFVDPMTQQPREFIAEQELSIWP